MKTIKAKFPPCDAELVFAHGPDSIPVDRFICIQRVHARTAPDVLVCFGDREILKRAFTGGRNGDHARHPGVTCLAKHLGQVLVQLRKGQMAVSINHVSQA